MPPSTPTRRPGRHRAVRRPGLRRVLPVRGMLRLRPAADIWYKPAISGVVAIGVPDVVLLVTGHLTLALYTTAGGLCALYAHGMPYAARARALAWVVVSMWAGTAISLTTAAYTDAAAIRVAVVAVLAAAYKVGCDAARLGPPGNIIFTFITATATFTPQQPGQLPGHLALVLLTGVFAWLICLAPALVRPGGPERLAVARALLAVARQADLPADDPAAVRARHLTAVAVQAAWQALRQTHADPAPTARLLSRAESIAADPAAGDPAQLTAWARQLRRGREVPTVSPAPAEAAELRGMSTERAPGRGGVAAMVRAFGPGSAYFPIGLRVAVGCAAAGWVSMALGVHRPYWAVVTAATVFVANTALSWHRAVQRAVGNLAGVLAYTALAPITHHPVAMIVAVLACQVGAEATMSRNYWLGSTFVTPMALLMTEFANHQTTTELVLNRWLDTCVGAVLGLLACFAIPNRRVTEHADAALGRVEAAIAAADNRNRLAAALVDLRESADTAAGEWWSTALPDERIVSAERRGHRLLAELTTGASR
ncbi:FUSC family protein [Nocardia sp. alder85J]|uniref:FUSC family protein n=1 Tax=Nocardia sp. alder85J TaxID=2862949 RepID=UPI001CD34A49|nr:FUSC family protein [Nocardia sp. alder85J]MCX4097014.1 FUSC family protein [Nocardia sp. alder85J]